jgi:putative endonuclease
MSRVSGKPYFVYVLWSPSGRRFYTGISEDPPRRLEQHNSSESAGWTRRYRPWELVYTEAHADYTSARKREVELKAQKGGRSLFLKTRIDPAGFRRAALPVV